MGFDVVYLPPIHPIGQAAKKGPNNTLDAGPDDPAAPQNVDAEATEHERKVLAAVAKAERTARAAGIVME